MRNHLFDFLDEVEGLPVGSTTANIEREKVRQGYSEKKYFRIFNNTDNEFFLRLFQNETEARHWVINHLDLSKQWNIEQEKTNPIH